MTTEEQIKNIEKELEYKVENSIISKELYYEAKNQLNKIKSWK